MHKNGRGGMLRLSLDLISHNLTSGVATKRSPPRDTRRRQHSNQNIQTITLMDATQKGAKKLERIGSALRLNFTYWCKEE